MALTKQELEATLPVVAEGPAGLPAAGETISRIREVVAGGEVASSRDEAELALHALGSVVACSRGFLRPWGETVLPMYGRSAPELLEGLSWLLETTDLQAAKPTKEQQARAEYVIDFNRNRVQAHNN